MAFSGNPNSAHQHQQSSMYQQQTSSHHMRGPSAMSFDTNPNSNMMYDYHASNNKMHRGSMNGLRQKLREAAGFPLREQHQNTGNSSNNHNHNNGMHSTAGAGQYGNTGIGRGGGSGNGKDYRNNNMNDPGFRGSHQRSSSYYNQDGGTNSSYGLHQPPPRFSHQSFPQSSMMTQYPQQPIMPRGSLYEPNIGGPMMGPYNMMMHQQQPMMMYPQQYQNSLAGDPMMGMGMGMMGSMPMPEPYLNPYQSMQPSMYSQHPMMMMSSSYNNPMGPMVPDQGMFPGTMPYGSYPSSYHSMPYNNRFSSGFW